MAIGSISLLQLASGPVNSTLTVSTGRPQAPINNLRASLSLGKNGRATAAATVSTASILVVPDRIRVSRRQSSRNQDVQNSPWATERSSALSTAARPGRNARFGWSRTPRCTALAPTQRIPTSWFANSPIVQAAAYPRGTSLGISQFPAALNKFPDPIEKFPDTRFKIPCYCE